ncbi:MAG: Bacterial regulatory protein luxR family [Armatimonadota bacterium]
MNTNEFIESGCPLTSREHAVLHLLTEQPAAPPVLLAAKLGCSLSTFRKHLSNVRTKMGVSCQTEMIVRAVQYGWINLPRLTFVASDQRIGLDA